MRLAKINSDKVVFFQIFIPSAAYEKESLNIEKVRFIIEEGHFLDANYPFIFKPNFSTLGSIIENSRQRPLFSITPNDSIRDLLGFNAGTIYAK